MQYASVLAPTLVLMLNLTLPAAFREARQQNLYPHNEVYVFKFFIFFIFSVKFYFLFVLNLLTHFWINVHNLISDCQLLW